MTDGPANAFGDGLAALTAFSSFAGDVYRRYPDIIEALWRDDQFTGDDFDCAGLLSRADDESMMTTLRRARHVGLFRVLWRDVHQLANTQTVLRETSDLAEVLITAALAAATADLQRHGLPRDRHGDESQIVVFGLGKLGGRELNFSSDIDLVFAYRAAGQTDGPRVVENERYFVQLVRRTVALLGETTEHGQCYRVDLRLRPFGGAGRLALSFEAMDQYFQREGRDWERYAWIKARPVAGDQSGGERWLKSLRPFIYRRYLDFGAYDALRTMKAMISAEVVRRQLEDDVKLGRGGIREIEFIAQAFQLVRGGREAALRTRSLRTALGTLADLGVLEKDVVARLLSAYDCLRTVENRFQQVADQQTHQPPDDSALRDPIARSIGLRDFAALARTVATHRQFVASRFDGLFAEPANARVETAQTWTNSDRAERFAAFMDSSELRPLGQRARRQVNQLLDRLAVLDEPDAAIESVLEVIARIARRTTYLALLIEHPEVLRHLVRSCAASAWLRRELLSRPMLLDDLIDRRRPDTGIKALLAARVASADGELEYEMDALREVFISRRFQIARALLDGDIDADDCGILLTELADAELVEIAALAERDVAARYGHFANADAGLAIVGYGTLGAGELGFESDLDLVFIYDGVSPDATTTGGPREIAAGVYFTRLVQRILHYLTTVTALGRLYEVDTRLRPNGRSGLLVSTHRSFFDYQRNSAWIWELQALTRARWVTGPATMADAFERERMSILRQPRDRAALAREIIEMRERMAAEQRASDDRFHIKHGLGGRTDLEFALQYARLGWAHAHPTLAAARSSRATLRTLASHELLDSAFVDQLLDADRGLRAALLTRELKARDPQIAAAEANTLAAPVKALWKQWFDAERD